MEQNWQKYCDNYETLTFEEKQTAWEELDRHERRAFATTWESYKKSIFKPPHSPPASKQGTRRASSSGLLRWGISGAVLTLAAVIWWWLA